MMFLDCPAYSDDEGTARCGLPAEVQYRYVVRSSDGPVESAKIRCPRGHWFNGPIEFLTLDRNASHYPGHADAATRSRYDCLPAKDDGLSGAGELVVREVPGRREQQVSRRNGAPAYYLGRPASLWITALRPRRGRSASVRLIEAVTGG